MGNINCCQEERLNEIDNIKGNNYKFEKNWNDKDLITACEKIQNQWRKNNKIIKNKKEFNKDVHKFKDPENKFILTKEKFDLRKENFYLYSIKEKHKKEIISFLGNNNLNNFPLYRNEDCLYQGTFDENDKKHGIGRIYFFQTKTYYEGNFDNDEYSGKGFIFKDKCFFYIGEFTKNKSDGHGYYQSIDGLVYIGQFFNNFFHGEGLLIFPNKKGVYKGQFLNGKKDGIGELKLKDKGIYFGYFENDNLDGNGIYTFNNRNCYIGEFKNNLFEGNGIMIYNNGLIYEGEFKNNKKEGLGKLIKFNKSFTEILLDRQKALSNISKNNYKIINESKDNDNLILPTIKLSPLVKKESEYINIENRILKGEKYKFYFKGTWKNDLLNGKIIYIKENKNISIIFKNGIVKPINKLDEVQTNDFISTFKLNTNEDTMSLKKFIKTFKSDKQIIYYLIAYKIYQDEEIKDIDYNDFIDFTNKFYNSELDIISSIYENINIDEFICEKLGPILKKIEKNNAYKIKDFKNLEEFNKLSNNLKDMLLNLFKKMDINNTNIINKDILEELFLLNDEYKKKLINDKIFIKLKDFIKIKYLQNEDKLLYLDILKYIENPNTVIEDKDILKYLKLYIYSKDINVIDDLKGIISSTDISDIILFEKLVYNINKFSNKNNYNILLFDRVDHANTGKICIDDLQNNEIISNNSDFQNFFKFVHTNNLIENNYINKQNIANNIKQVNNFLYNELNEIILKIRLDNNLEKEEIYNISELFETSELLNDSISLNEFFEITQITKEKRSIFIKLSNLYKIENYLNSKVISVKELNSFVNGIKKNII